MKLILILLSVSLCFSGITGQLSYSGLTILNLAVTGTADAYMCKDVPDSLQTGILWHWWSVQNKHTTWLAMDNVILPIGRCWTSRCCQDFKSFALNTWGSYLIGSVCWDLVFKKMTKGVWVAQEDWWLIIGNHKIAFTKNQYIIFHTIRLIIGSALIYSSF